MTMVEYPAETMKEEGIADLLWRRLRSKADRLLEHRAGRGQIDPRIRGEIYLFIVDLITRWVDRIERNEFVADVISVEGMLRAGMDEIRGRLNGRAVHGPATP
jgi:hypothetical protein